MNIKTGDTVMHKPTGEEWLVAGVDNGQLMWCGWPEGSVPVEDCELVKSTSDEDSIEWLRILAAMTGPDMRKRYAIRMLEKMERAA